MSGPFNYVRNIKYSFPADMTPPSSLTILRDLWDEVRFEYMVDGGVMLV